MVMLSITHLLFILIALLLSYIIMIRKKSFLAFILVGFIVFDSLGISIAPYLPLENISYLPNPIFLINDGNIELYARQLFSHWIFFSIAIVGIMIELNWKTSIRSYNSIKLNKYTLNIWGFIFFVIGILFYIKYFFLGPGLGFLMDTRLFYSSTMEAIGARSIIRDTLQKGQGAWSASLAAQILFPLTAFCYLAGKQKKSIITRIMYMILFSLSLAYAYQTRQKAPILGVILIYILLWKSFSISYGTSIKDMLGKITKLAFMTGIIGGILLYAVNFGLPFKEATLSLIARIFIIPGATETNFFAVFPEYFDYRGILKIFAIPLRYSSNDISIYQVAYAALGDRSSSNASFLAVAWSGYGYIGIFIISIIFISLILLIDYCIRNVDICIFYATLAISSYSILGLISGSFSDFINKGGLVAFIIIIVMSSMKVKLNSNIPYFKYYSMLNNDDYHLNI